MFDLFSKVGNRSIDVAIGETTRKALYIAARCPFVTNVGRDTTIVGSPSEVLGKVNEFRRLGMDHII